MDKDHLKYLWQCSKKYNKYNNYNTHILHCAGCVVTIALPKFYMGPKFVSKERVVALGVAVVLGPLDLVWNLFSELRPFL